MLNDLNYLDNNAQIMKQQNENVSDYKTSLWRKQSSSTNQFIRANKCVKIRISNSKEVKITITLLIGKMMEMVQREAGEPAAYFVFVVCIMTEIPYGKIGIYGGDILHSLTKGSEWHIFLSMQFRIAGT